MESLPIQSYFAVSANEALQHLNEKKVIDFPHVIVIDIDNPSTKGQRILEEYQDNFLQDHPGTLLFVASNFSYNSEINKISEHPVVMDILQKPFTKYTFEHIISPLLLNSLNKGLKAYQPELKFC